MVYRDIFQRFKVQTYSLGGNTTIHQIRPFRDSGADSEFEQKGARFEKNNNLCKSVIF